MKNATALLLALRPSASVVEVKPKKYKAGKENLCFQNAAIFAATREGYELVSGWMVGDTEPGFGTILVPHYWVIHITSGEYFDTTPRAAGDDQNYEYVVDMDIYKYVTQTSYIPPAVILREDGSIQARMKTRHYVDLQRIDILELYKLVRN